MPLFKKHKVEPAPPAPPTAAANVAAAFGVTKDYRDRWGEEAFRALSSVAFAEADADKSGVMELGELKATLSKVRIVLSDDEVAQVLQKYDADASGTISEDEWHTLLGDLLDGTLTFFSPAATKSKKAKGGGDKGGDKDPVEEHELATLRFEVESLREENQQLKTRVQELVEEKEKAIIKQLEEAAAGGGALAPQEPKEPKKKIVRNTDSKKAPKKAAGSKKAPGTVANEGAEPPADPWATADPDRWQFEEVLYGGAYRFTTCGKTIQERAPIADGIAKLKADPASYVAMWFQADMVDWPTDQQRYTLLSRKGTKGFVPSDVSPQGRFKCLTAKYQRLPLEAEVDISPVADGYTGPMDANRNATKLGSYEGYLLEQPVCPGRGKGVGDVPSLKFLNDIDPSDISQGGVGDCWLLCGIASLAEFDGAIEHLFRKTTAIPTLPLDGPNQYTVTLWDLTTWSEVDVVVDERLARKADGTGLLGCEISKDGELWGCYLEKACAAHAGGWDKINGGQCTHAWALLTGCKEQYTIKKPSGKDKYGCFGAYNCNENRWEALANSPHEGFQGLWPMEWPEVGGGGAIGLELTEDEVFERMCAWDDTNYIMGAGTTGASDADSTDGIVDNHAYSVLECLNDVAGTEVDLIKVRNPWGKGEIQNGEWDDDGPGWEQYPQIKELLNPVKADDGIFWMSKKEFFEYFVTLYLCAKDMTEFIK